MRRTGLQMLVTSAAIVVAAAVLLPVTAFGVERGTNGWYWPEGSSETTTWGSWLQWRPWYPEGRGWHLAWDDMGTFGDPVYALAQGRILVSRMDVGGYGSNGTDGGAMVVLYKTSTGRYFKALYGHINIDTKRYYAGKAVAPGEIIARLNNFKNSAGKPMAHDHFGIHPGTAYPTATRSSTSYVGIMMGHTHDYTVSMGTTVPVTYGWTDPVAYLNERKPWVVATSLSAPSMPAVLRARRAFVATGTLGPWAPRGSTNVMLQCERLEGRAWVLRASFAGTVVSESSSGPSEFRVTARVPSSGSWRARSFSKGDLGWASTGSAYTYFTAR